MVNGIIGLEKGSAVLCFPNGGYGDYSDLRSECMRAVRSVCWSGGLSRTL